MFLQVSLVLSLCQSATSSVMQTQLLVASSVGKWQLINNSTIQLPIRLCFDNLKYVSLVLSLWQLTTSYQLQIQLLADNSVFKWQLTDNSTIQLPIWLCVDNLKFVLWVLSLCQLTTRSRLQDQLLVANSSVFRTVNCQITSRPLQKAYQHSKDVSPCGPRA